MTSAEEFFARAKEGENRIRLEVEGYSEPFLVQEIPNDKLDIYDELVEAPTGLLQATLCVWGLVSEDGERIFTDDQADEFSQRTSLRLTAAIAKAVLQASGMDKDATEKKSEDNSDGGD